MTELIILVIGVYWIVTGIRIATCPKATRGLIDTFEENQALTFLGGIVLLVAGIAVLWKHNLWDTPQEIFATAVVWIATIEGALMIAAPSILFRLGRTCFPNDKMFRIIGIVMVPLGAFVIWWAFSAG